MRQSFAWWSFTGRLEMAPRAFLRAARAAGVEGVEMVPPELWDAAREEGLTLVTHGGHGKLEEGFNDPARHATLREEVRGNIERAAANGIEKLIVFAGNRFGDGADAPAISACVDGLAPLAEEAAQAGVTLVLELLNSKVDHPGHQCDRSAFGVAVAKQVNSPGLRLLYDCYHMQLMEGDLSRTIKANFDLIGHFHTGGAPGRRDLDDRQEVNWRGIAGLLRHLGYAGWVGHEFVPRGDPIMALRHATALFAAP